MVVCDCFLFEGYGDHRDLQVLTHSFPTRRSSDLASWSPTVSGAPSSDRRRDCTGRRSWSNSRSGDGIAVFAVELAHRVDRAIRRPDDGSAGDRLAQRSEEHTSELQSLMRLSYAVFCLKNNTNHFLILSHHQ